MIIALDFDGTFTLDPDCWAMFVRSFQLHGHTVICVTGRSDSGGMGDQVRDQFAAVGLDVPIVFAGSEWKVDAARAAGWEVNVWIDDMPQYVAPPPMFVGMR